MDAREQLRTFLRQRLEVGETELVLDEMTAAEALSALKSTRTRRERRGPDQGAAAGDWRATLRAAGAAGAAEAPAPAVDRPADAAARTEAPAWVPPPKGGTAEQPAQPSRPGLVVGTTETELFAGPLGEVSDLGGLADLVAGCTRCPLHQTARNPVPGTGNPRAGLMVVGEAPGATEDEQGKPFVGAAGQLLTKILAAIQLSREDVFITNVLKHRPPLNRNPLPHEVQACSPYLLRQLEIIRPKAILALGTFAAQTLLQTNQTIGSLRSFVHRYHGIPLVVTYHPAALLRNPSWKRPTWQDVQLVRRILDSATADA